MDELEEESSSSNPAPSSAVLLYEGKREMSIQLHSFCDASKDAYSGVIYVRVMYAETSTSVTLFTARPRWLLLSPTTIPRLELCGALLLSKLLETAKASLEVPADSIFAWTDLSIVLSWLNYTPSKLQTYVMNQVSQTIDRVPASCW